jgi:hypothetical protein
MRFTTTIASSIASLILLCDQTQGQAGNILQHRFAIGGPDYTYDDLQFTMHFEVSDFMEDNMIAYSLYDGMNCRDGGDNDITENDGYLLSRIRTDNTPIGDGSGIRSIRVQSEIVPNSIVESGIYRTDDDDNGVIEFCLRFGVYNMDKNEPRAFETNFLEIPIKLTIEMDGTFSVRAIVDSIGLVLASASQGVAVEAYICDREDNVVPIMPTGQGQIVRVCVSPTAENLAAGTLIRQLEQFTFRREIPTSTKQVAIESKTGGVPADGLTIVSCQPGSTVCAFETLLQAAFFTGPGIIAGKQGRAASTLLARVFGFEKVY